MLLQGYVYLEQEKRPALEGLVKQVQPIIYELTESERRSALLLTLADLQYAVGRKESGNQSAQQAVNFLQKTPDPSKAIFVLSKLALSQFNSEKSNETLKTLDYISELVEKIKGNPNKPSFLQSIGGLYLKLAETEDLKVTKLQEKSKTAMALFGKAKQLFQKSEQISTPQDRKTEAYAKNLLTFGRAYLGLRENEEAIEKAKQSIEIIKELEKKAGIPEPKQKKQSIECWALGWIVSSICENKEEEDNTELAILNQSHITLKRMRRDARDIMAAAQLDQGRYSESDINLREALRITREIDERLKDYSKKIRMINGISGVIAMLPLGPISDFGSYINMNTGSLDQLIILPQGGFLILDRVNLELINKSKQYNLSDLKKKQEEARSNNDASGEAEITLKIGSSYLAIGRFRDASQAFEDAANLFNTLHRFQQPLQNGKEKWIIREAEAWLGSGRSLYLERNYDKAQIIISKALDIFGIENNVLGSANAWLTLGNISLSQSKFSRCKEQLQTAFNLFSKSEDDKDSQLGLANTSLALGTVLLKQRKYKDALREAETAIGIFQVLRNETESARARLLRGSAHKSLGDHRKAIEDAQKALFIFKDRGDRLGEISALANIGDALQSQQRYEQAIKFYGLSTDLQKDLQQYVQKPKKQTGWLVDVFRVGSFFLPWIGALGQTGLKVYNALSVAQSIVYLSEGITADTGSGSSYLSLGQYDQAMNAFDRVRKVSKGQDPLREGEALLGLSNTRLSFDKEYDMARNDAERAEQLFNDIGDRAGSAYALVAQGISHNRIGNSQADVEIRKDHFNKGFYVLQQAISIFKDPEVSDLGGEAQAYSAFADLISSQGNKNIASIFYKKSIQITEKIRQEVPDGKLSTAYIGSISDTYRQLIEILLSQGDVLEAQQILELLKIQEIREFDSSSRTKISSTGELISFSVTEKKIIEGGKYKSYVSFINEVGACQRMIPKCPENDKLVMLREKAAKEFEDTIQDLSKEIDSRKEVDKNNFLDPRNVLSGKAFTLLSKPNRAIIYSLVSENRLWLIVATKNAPLRTFEVAVSRKELSMAVGKFRLQIEKCQSSVCTQADTEALKTESLKIYRWLFPEELQKELPKSAINHLMFSLDRNIRYIPMAALFDGNSYLIEKYAISTITTAVRPDNQPFVNTLKDTSVLAMGASQFTDSSQLPEVKAELNSIVKSSNTDTIGVFNGSKYLNKDFTKSNLKSSLIDRNILHLATHGVFNLRSPEDSYISLGDNDKLTVSEIRNIPITGISLVVLSACQTALGGRIDEEGVEIASLASAFLDSNRSESVLATLWRVNDNTTSQFMKEFYRNLSRNTDKNPITRSEALRQAQLRFLIKTKTKSDTTRRSFIIEDNSNKIIPAFFEI